MTISLIREASLPLSSWAGGTSREYYIYPPEAAYGEKNFLVRFSMAASHSDTPCVYTELPGITRHLIILEGTATVSHEGHYELLMKPYKPVDVFDGGWKTVSRGKAVDFNLMLGKGAQGRMSLIESAGDFPLKSPDSASPAWLGLFCAAGSAVITGAGEAFTLQKGELLLLEDFSQENAVLRIAPVEGKLIRLDAWINPGQTGCLSGGEPC
jgi:environmental stress-induced protein Ves